MLTVDPSFQYVRANGGNGAVKGNEGFKTVGGTPIFGYIGGQPYFGGVDLNGDRRPARCRSKSMRRAKPRPIATA